KSPIPGEPDRFLFVFTLGLFSLSLSLSFPSVSRLCLYLSSLSPILQFPVFPLVRALFSRFWSIACKTMSPLSVLPLLASSAKIFQDLLRERIVLFDGAMGTSILARQLNATAFGGPEHEGCNEYLVLTAPEVICEIHEGFLNAGCDVIETDTFGG